MIRPTTIKEINWLHDAEVMNIEYRISEGERSLRILIHGHRDCGYSEWADKPVVIQAHDIADFSFRAPGRIGGMDTLDAVRGSYIGDKINLSFAFHSGAEIELSCATLSAGTSN